MLFREEVLKLICGYKKIIKKQLPQGAASKKFKKLGIKSRQLGTASDVELYHICSRIHSEITQEMLQNLPATYEYSGIVEFKQEIAQLIASYTLKNNTVTNKAFAGSKALLHAIQFISAPNNDQNQHKFEENLNDLMNYGTREQLAKMIQTLQKHGSGQENTYQTYIEPLLHLYKNKESHL